MREVFPRTDAAEHPKLGRYGLVSEVSRSLASSLWIARTDEGADVGRLVLVRRIERGTIDAGSVEALRRAGEAATRIRDPRIVAVLDVVVTDREVALVSEYIEGEPLRSVQRLAVQKGALLPVPASMRIALDLLMGMRAATDSFVRIASSLTRAAGVHGSVSPDCILVASFGDTMLTDLGVGGLGSAITLRSRPPSVLAYAAPECFEASATPDERADVFSVGVMLWELISGKPLFGGASDVDALAEKIRSTPVPRLDSIRRPGSPIPGRVADIVARALQRSPDSRYRTLEEMIRAIRGLDNGVATTDEVVTALDRIARPILEARRAALGQLGDQLTSRDSIPPESGRGTYRPPAPSIKTPIVPAIPANPIPRVRVPAAPRLPTPSALSTLGFPASATPRSTPPRPPPPRAGGTPRTPPLTGGPSHAVAPPPAIAPPRPVPPPPPHSLALPPPIAATPTLVEAPTPPAVAVAPPEPTPTAQPLEASATSREDEPKGPLAWAPDDSIRATPPDRVLGVVVSERTRKLLLHRVAPAVAIASAVLTLVILLSSSSHPSSSTPSVPEPSSSPSAAAAPERAPADPAPSTAPDQPPSAEPPMEPKKEAPAAAPRPQRTGGDHPKPAGDGFRPRGI